MKDCIKIALLMLAACGPDTFTSVPYDSGKPEGSLDTGSDANGTDARADAGDSSTDGAKPLCPDPNDVEHDGRCYYLDGSKGACDQGYTLSSNARLTAILGANANAWQGKGYKHITADSVCILTKDNVMNYGLLPNIAPFSAGNPYAGADGCWMISPPQMYPKQITLCESL